MRILFSSQSTVVFDGEYYYNNNINSFYKRYKNEGDELYCLAYIVNKPIKNESDRILKGAVNFVSLNKINSLNNIINKRIDNRKIIREQVDKADICFVHVPSSDGEYLINYAKKMKKPFMTVVCGCPWDAMWNYDFRGKLLAPFSYMSMKNALKKSEYSIYVTKEFLQRRYPTYGKCIACSNVNIKIDTQNVLENRLNKINRLSSHSLLKIGTTAAIDVPFKGQEYVIRALAELKKENILFEYHLVGGGSKERLEGICKKYGVEKQVFFHGILKHEDVFTFLDEIDIYVQPSKQEGLPRAIIEAMSRGLLCIGSNIAGIPELLQEEYLFEKGNVNKIVDILKNISEEKFIFQAKRNINEAKQYDCELLNKKRATFIQEFRDSSSGYYK